MIRAEAPAVMPWPAKMDLAEGSLAIDAAAVIGQEIGDAATDPVSFGHPGKHCRVAGDVQPLALGKQPVHFLNRP